MFLAVLLFLFIAYAPSYAAIAENAPPRYVIGVEKNTSINDESNYAKPPGWDKYVERVKSGNTANKKSSTDNVKNNNTDQTINTQNNNTNAQNAAPVIRRNANAIQTTQDDNNASNIMSANNNDNIDFFIKNTPNQNIKTNQINADTEISKKLTNNITTNIHAPQSRFVSDPENTAKVNAISNDTNINIHSAQREASQSNNIAKNGLLNKIISINNNAKNKNKSLYAKVAISAFANDILHGAAIGQNKHYVTHDLRAKSDDKRSPSFLNNIAHADNTRSRFVMPIEEIQPPESMQKISSKQNNTAQEKYNSNNMYSDTIFQKAYDKIGSLGDAVDDGVKNIKNKVASEREEKERKKKPKINAAAYNDELLKQEMMRQQIENEMTKGTPIPEKHNKKIFNKQILPPNISQKVYDKHNTHLTPVIFEEELKQQAFDMISDTDNLGSVLGIVAKLKDLNFKDNTGNTLLHYATYYAAKYNSEDYYAFIKNIISNGINVNAMNKEGQTALHIASSYGNYDLCYELLFANADPNAKDLNGNTPTMLAALISDIDTMKLFASLGGDFKQSNMLGDSALEFAMLNEDRGVREFMTEDNSFYSSNIQQNKKIISLLK